MTDTRAQIEQLLNKSISHYQVESDKLKSVELSTLEKINNSKFGKFGHTLIDETTVTIATMEDEQTGEKYHLFIEGEDVRDNLQTYTPSASIADLIDTVIHLLKETDLIECLQDNDDFSKFDSMTSTEKCLSIYDIFIKSSNKDEALALVCSPFFKHMTEDSESCEARGILDYLIDMLKR